MPFRRMNPVPLKAVMSRVVFARSPIRELQLRRGIQLIGGRQAEDEAGVQVEIRPSVEPAADAGREGVVDGRMAQRAGDAQARDSGRCCSRCR